MVVDRRRGALQQEDVPAAHVLADLDLRLAVGEVGDRALSQRLPEVFADFPRQRLVGVAGEEDEVRLVDGHECDLARRRVPWVRREPVPARSNRKRRPR